MTVIYDVFNKRGYFYYYFDWAAEEKKVWNLLTILLHQKSLEIPCKTLTDVQSKISVKYAQVLW